MVRCVGARPGRVGVAFGMGNIRAKVASLSAFPTQTTRTSCTTIGLRFLRRRISSRKRRRSSSTISTSSCSKGSRCCPINRSESCPRARSFASTSSTRSSTLRSNCRRTLRFASWICLSDSCSRNFWNLLTLPSSHREPTLKIRVLAITFCQDSCAICQTTGKKCWP
uniref:(northern house mosquito) hypothetical protein n=1 Tax=Culex pipiens TaxID=7175 RepID=A0A8D8I7D0_CULPI